MSLVVMSIGFIEQDLANSKACLKRFSPKSNSYVMVGLFMVTGMDLYMFIEHEKILYGRDFINSFNFYYKVKYYIFLYLGEIVHLGKIRSW